MSQIYLEGFAHPAATLGFPGSNPATPLHFNADGTFQLSIFEDLHTGENAWDSWGPQQDINTVKVINKVLDKEFPNLVVLNGDLITGDNAFLENATIYIEQIVGPLLNRNLPWASAYGNHDHQYNLSSDALLAHEQQWPNSRTQKMVAGSELEVGTSNYYLPVYGTNCTILDECPPDLILWFFDSRGGARFQERNAAGKQIGLQNWVDTKVVEWFQQTNAELVNKYQKTLPSFVFVHIPTYASLAFQQTGVRPHYEPGINDDCPDSETNDGSCEYGGQDIPFMQAISTVPGIIGVFSGHDHGDTWCYKWDSQLPNMTVAGNGVNLCFGQHSGYGGYGNWERGARQVLISKSQLGAFEADTWIRLESGNVVGAVTLNTTYGMDWYPATNNTKTSCPTCNYTIVTPRPDTKKPLTRRLLLKI
ncbi:Metallo-dependent phosphatase [Bimuria novae-zelandiae CBS 107.79]|uniref:Metallo-dependent phosphatase n=1 Tax=Bimuria novae-zelandiae CBS 107.79 TaxID=1447943 RepID=A0A6A5USW4_9PLEO|nr:Metallo-dependent phosphatase [Bimuria novae-zelandiae CBS 107.79]